jgi:putative copper export protein
VAGYYVALSLHLLAAAIWVGGHLTLALTILRRALKEGGASIVSDFDQSCERVGLAALVCVAPTIP